MKVHIPGPLLSYTHASSVIAEGETVAAVMADLDHRYPGLRFRVVDEQGHLRPHMRLFVNKEPVRDLARPLTPGDEIILVQALSGG